jgi:hypothetical protein
VGVGLEVVWGTSIRGGGPVGLSYDIFLKSGVGLR